MDFFFRLTVLIASLVLLLQQTTSQSYAQDQGGYEDDYYGDYQDYAGDYGQEDNLYYDYAQRQEAKT